MRNALNTHDAFNICQFIARQLQIAALPIQRQVQKPPFARSRPARAGGMAHQRLGLLEKVSGMTVLDPLVAG